MSPLLPQRIVLSGVIGSGKSTLGDKLEKRFGYQVCAFADPLKHAVQAAFGMKTEDLWGPSDRRDVLYRSYPHDGFCFDCQAYCYGPERTLSPLQWDDVEAIERVRKEWDLRLDFWECDGCQARYPRYITPREALKTMGTAWGRRFSKNVWITRTFSTMLTGKSYVITDGRFHSERRAAREAGAANVLLLRNLEASTSPHPSEAEVRESFTQPGIYDLILDNRNGTPDENFERLVELLRGLSQNSARYPEPIRMCTHPSFR
jgi:hypothetical protein